MKLRFLISLYILYFKALLNSGKNADQVDEYMLIEESMVPVSGESSVEQRVSSHLYSTSICSVEYASLRCAPTSIRL